MEAQRKELTGGRVGKGRVGKVKVLENVSQRWWHSPIQQPLQCHFNKWMHNKWQ